jgi:hypothetical protein
MRSMVGTYITPTIFIWNLLLLPYFDKISLSQNNLAQENRPHPTPPSPLIQWELLQLANILLNNDNTPHSPSMVKYCSVLLVWSHLLVSDVSPHDGIIYSGLLDQTAHWVLSSNFQSSSWHTSICKVSQLQTFHNNQCCFNASCSCRLWHRCHCLQYHLLVNTTPSH